MERAKETAERFEKLNRLFDELVEVPAAEREAALDAACGDDRGLRAELRSLLVAAAPGASTDDFVMDVVATEAAELTKVDVSGHMLGPWKIVRPLAEGGMGMVYVAERADGAYEAEAAVKLVRGGIPSPALDARLRAERQILAGLSHPGIAQLLDGGSTDDGTPYLVLELVDGSRITDWCDEQRLGIDERLELFVRVCESVSYAHGQLVAHRDLKPSNILVTRDGDPKLLDFGIAKLLDAIDEGSEGLTHTGALMTPAYASPEQVAGERAGVSTDVYALGVLLYQLLSGRLPLETGGLTPMALSRVVVDEIPPLLSSVADPALRRRLSGDLDAVVSKALRKHPHERYPSVQALAEDIRRHLEGLPVRVRHDDWAYRTGRLLRRNAGVVSVTTVSIIALLSFTVSTVIQARALARERDRAEAQRVTAERVSGFLEELLSEADPNESAGREVTAREVLDRGSARIMDDLATEPEVQAALATVMGRVYRNLGRYESAEPLLDSSLAVRRRLDSTDDFTLGVALIERGALSYDVGDYEEALLLHGEAREALTRASNGDDEQTLADAIDWMASSSIALGRGDEAEEYSRQAFDMTRRLNPEPSPSVAVAAINLADILRDRGAYDEATELIEEGLAIMRASHGDVHLETAWALNQLASTLTQNGRSAEAVPYAREGLEIRKAVHEGPHPEVGASLGNLANILTGLQRYDEAEEARRESVEVLRAAVGDDHPYVAGSTFSLGSLLATAGKTAEAIEVLTEAVRLHRVAFPPRHPNLAYPLTSLGRLMLEADDAEAARRYLAEAYDLRKEGLPEGHWHVAASGLDLGRALDRLGREAEAEQYLREAFTTLERELGPDDRRTGQGRDALRDHYERRGMAAEAAELGVG